MIRNEQVSSNDYNFLFSRLTPSFFLLVAQPPRLPKDEFSEFFCDFIDKCLKKDQNERWSIKQLLQHEFLRSCREKDALSSSVSSRSSFSTSASSNGMNLSSLATVDESHEEHKQEDEEHVEIDEITRKVVQYYTKNAKEFILEHQYSLPDIISWIQLLPPMQKK